LLIAFQLTQRIMQSSWVYEISHHCFEQLQATLLLEKERKQGQSSLNEAQIGFCRFLWF
jgi:hypothetical protein